MRGAAVRPPQYKQGDVVWLKASGPPKYAVASPRQLAQIIVVQGVRHHPSWPPGVDEEMYVVRVVPDPTDPDDDGLRELEVELIEGLANEQDREEFSQHEMSAAARAYLEQAGPYIGYTP